MSTWYLMLLVMTVLGSAASLFLKRASGSKGIFEMMKNVNLYIGAGLYLLSAVLNIIVLRHLEYSIVLPLTSITYIWTMIISYLVLREKLTWRKLGGVMLIIAGAAMLSAA